MKSLILLLLMALATFSQNFEYGGPSDLKGLTKVQLSPEIDFKDQERIKKEINKAKLSSLVVTDNYDDGEIMLVFGGSTETVTTGATVNNGVVNTIRVPLDEGTGYVFVEGKSGKPRLVLKVSNSQQSRLEKRPVTKFVDTFLKAYRQANDLDPKK